MVCAGRFCLSRTFPPPASYLPWMQPVVMILAANHRCAVVGELFSIADNKHFTMLGNYHGSLVSEIYDAVVAIFSQK